MTILCRIQGETFTMTGERWSDTYPIKDLPKWIRFYEKLSRKTPVHYDETLANLKALYRIEGERLHRV